MIVRIKIFSDFSTPQACKISFEGICQYIKPYYYGCKSIMDITDEDDYTHAIILNTCQPPLKIAKKNVIGLACEPYEFLGINDSFIDYAKKHIGKYYIGDKRHLPDPFVERIGYMWHGIPLREINEKEHIMSIVLSNKKLAPGHIYRHELVKKIIQLGLPIDIYGRGSEAYINLKTKNIKGHFKGSQPYEKYMFSIAIENYKNNDYISEKFITPLMFNCKPIYWGANNIFKYVSEEDTVLLTQNIDKDIEIIKKILASPNDYYKTFNKKNIKSFNLILNLPELFGMHSIKNPY